MKLILSSCDFGHAASRQIIVEHLPKPIDQCRVLFIPNEKSTPERLKSGMYDRRMQSHGFSEGNISVFDPACSEQFFHLPLDVLYVSGGNTFKTLDMLRRCHFDQEIVRYIQSGVTYVGGSAGAHLVTADISHLTCYDEAPDGMTDFRALNLFPGILLCHFTQDRLAHYETLCAQQKYPVHALTDEDSLIIQD